MAGLAFCASSSAEARTAAAICSGVGGLQRNATVRAAAALHRWGAAPRSLGLQSQRPEQGAAFGPARRGRVQLVQTPADLVEQLGGLVEQR